MKNKKNGGVIPPVSDSRVLLVPVGCGKCMECMKKKARDWQVRLGEEVRHDTSGKFVTLTFSDEALEELTEVTKEFGTLEGYDLDNQIATVACKRFLERWRKSTGKSVKHWLVTEIGGNGTERLHLHGLLFTDQDESFIKDRWKYGHVWVGQWVNEQTINYIVKYLHKTDEKHKEYTPKILTSAGIGKGYLSRKDWKNNKFKKGKTDETYKTRSGANVGLPIYYRNKIYTEDEKEALWLEKLDKEERWVNGTRVDVSNGDDDYFALLATARRKNERLGYGNNSINWERRIYENNRRRLKKKGKNLGR